MFLSPLSLFLSEINKIPGVRIKKDKEIYTLLHVNYILIIIKKLKPISEMYLLCPLLESSTSLYLLI